MNHLQRNSWMIGLLGLVIMAGVGCTPAQIVGYAPSPRAFGNASPARDSAPNRSAMPAAQRPIDLPGKSDNRGSSDETGRSDGRDKSNEKGGSNDRGKSDDGGRSENKGKSTEKGKA